MSSKCPNNKVNKDTNTVTAKPKSTKKGKVASIKIATKNSPTVHFDSEDKEPTKSSDKESVG